MTDAALVALAAARWVHFASVMLLFGASLFPFYAGIAISRMGGDATASMMSPALRVAAVVAALSGLSWAAASLAQISGSVAGLFDTDALDAFLFETSFGTVWLFRFGVLAALTGVVFAARRSLFARERPAALVVILTAVLLVSQSRLGHPAASTGTQAWIVAVGYALHILGAGAWLGGLVPLWLTLRKQDETSNAQAEQSLKRFSSVGLLAISVVLAGGTINTWARWNPDVTLLQSAWWQMLLVKIAIFLALLALASVNRLVLTPKLCSENSARQQLERNVLFEQIGGLVILAAASILGILAPPA